LKLSSYSSIQCRFISLADNSVQNVNAVAASDNLLQCVAPTVSNATDYEVDILIGTVTHTNKIPFVYYGRLTFCRTSAADLHILQIHFHCMHSYYFYTIVPVLTLNILECSTETSCSNCLVAQHTRCTWCLGACSTQCAVPTPVTCPSKTCALRGHTLSLCFSNQYDRSN